MHTWAHTETYTRIFFDIFLETSSPVSVFISEYENPLALYVCTDRRAREVMSPRINLHPVLQSSYKIHP